MRMRLVFLFVIVVFSNLLQAQQAPVGLRPSADYSWWRAGEEVVFKPVGALPEGIESLEGRIYTVDDKGVASVTANRADLSGAGWKWKPELPGFYEIEFFYRDASGNKIPVTETFARKAPNGEKKDFERRRFSVAVVAAPAKEFPRTGQFGWQYHLNQKEIPLAKLVGFEFTMIHSIPWGAHFTNLKKAIQPERDVWNWTDLDSDVDALTKAGFEVGGQFCYTPAWASPHPEKIDDINICVREANAYAPKDMQDFTNFLTKTVERYKDRIRIWEIWNEPNLPGSSCFWSDTPENYFRMQKAGYETIKKIQPEAEVWNGGIGMRPSYLTFYARTLQLGMEPYFDKLSLHALTTDVDAYRKVEQALGVASKPPVISEWHAILIGNMSDKYMAPESALSMRMMRDQLMQIKQGVVKNAIFEITNQVEKEVINFAIANKWFTHSSGLFRISPRVEPRHAAVVMANFLNITGKKAVFVKEVQVGEEGIGIFMKTNNGPLLAFWSEKSPLNAKDLGKMVTSKSSVYDWEGRKLDLSKQPVFSAGAVYYLVSPDESVLAKAAAADRLLPPSRQRIKGDGSAPVASYHVGQLFKDPSQAVALQEAPWITNSWKWVPVATGSKPVITAKALVGSSEEGLDICVEVKDARHVQNEDKWWWNGDSVQIAVDCEGLGLFGAHAEVIAALKPDGVLFWKMANAQAGADLPTRISLPNSPVQYGECRITREGDMTVYRMRLPWTELYPMAFNPRGDIKISFLVNNNDGKGREGYLEWSSGIGEGEKDPSLFGTLKPATR